MKDYLKSGFNSIQDIKLEAGTYTLVLYVKSMYGNVYTFALGNGVDWVEYDVDVIQGKLCKVWMTFTITRGVTKFKPIANNYSLELPVYVTDLQLTRGNVPVESGASPFDVDQILDDLHDDIGGIEDFTNDAFRDGLLNREEKTQLRGSLDAIGSIVESVKGSYDKLLDNPFIGNNTMTSITNRYYDFIASWLSDGDPRGLKPVILWVVNGDNIISDEERTEKDRALNSFNKALFNYNQAEKQIYNDIGEDSIQPIITEDGFWAFWNPKKWNKETKQYGAFEKSTFSAIGDDGHSPYIDVLTETWWEWDPDIWNPITWKYGNYWDTRVKAVGVDGKDATAPIITEDGFWAFWNPKKWNNETQEYGSFENSGFSAEGDDGRSPYIDETTGTWWEWESDLWNSITQKHGKYQDTGVKAEGFDAKSIDIHITPTSVITNWGEPNTEWIYIRATAENTFIDFNSWKFFVDDFLVEDISSIAFYNEQEEFWTVKVYDDLLRLYPDIESLGVSVKSVDTPSLSKSMDIPFIREGIDGLNTATVYLHKRYDGDEDIPMPTTDLTYNFITEALEEEPDNEWTENIPDGYKQLHVIGATASSRTNKDVIGPNEWSEAVKISSNGFNSASITLYQRKNEKPEDITQNSEYTFSSGDLDPIPSGWYKYVPLKLGIKKLWVTTATAISTKPTDIIKNTEWATPTVMAEDGQGALKATYFIRSNEEPKPPIGGTYLDPNPEINPEVEEEVWSDGIPSGDKRLWASTRVFTSDGLPPEQDKWTKPEVMVDSAGFDVEFSEELTPGTPNSHPDNWSNNANERTIWMAISRFEKGEWTPWEITKIKGEKGDKGIDGCIIRTSSWQRGVTYYNDTNLKHPRENQDSRYIDVITIDDSAKIQENLAYKCNVSSTTEDPLNTNTNHWIKLEKTEPIYTSLLLADYASIKFMQGNRLFMMGSDNKVTAGISGKQRVGYGDAGIMGTTLPAFWSGGDYNEALIPATENERKAGIVLNHDGSGYMANGNIHWDRGGNLIATLEGFTLNDFIEAPEIRNNRTTLIGEEMVIGAGGMIKDVVHISGDKYEVTLKLQDGEPNPFKKDDIIKGIFYHKGWGGVSTGFGVTWIGVISIDDDKMSVWLADDSDVVGGKNMPPQKFMNIVRWGNLDPVTNPDRLSVIVMSAKDRKIVQYGGLTAFSKKGKNGENVTAGAITTQWGRAEGLEFIENWEHLPITKDSDVLYTDTLLYNKQIKVDNKGVVIKEFVDKGQWVQGMECQVTETTIDEVWYNSEKFRMKNADIPYGTTETPTRNSNIWMLILSIKDGIEEGVESGRGSMTFFVKPENYKKGDRWVLIQDTQLLNNYYKKGQALEAVYATGNDSDWRLLVFADETDGINLVRNYTYKERTLIVEGETKITTPHWENAPKEAFVTLDDEIPTEYHNTSINVIGDEYGANYIITSEDDEAIQFDE